jgi:hypothetical protein
MLERTLEETRKGAPTMACLAFPAPNGESNANSEENAKTSKGDYVIGNKPVDAYSPRSLYVLPANTTLWPAPGPALLPTEVGAPRNESDRASVFTRSVRLR